MTEEETGVQLTPEEQGELARFMSGYDVGRTGSPTEAHNIHKFLNEVLERKDTTRVGYLNDAELGNPRLPERTLKELQLFCGDVADMNDFSEYFEKRAEILTSTSLSKNAKLLETAITNTRQIADVTKKPRAENKGWFKKKEVNETESV